MSAFGTLTLLIALVVATYAGVASVIGARRANRRLIESGRAGVYALAAILGLSSVALTRSVVMSVLVFRPGSAPPAHGFTSFFPSGS